ncbi:MAG: vitamin K epoxide reductase family protein [Patescibacteria group bacterium]
MKVMQSSHVTAVVAIAVLGLLDALYLYTAHITETSLLCGPLEGCNAVAASPYSILFGAPISLWGIFFYTCILILGIALVTDMKGYAKNILYGVGVLGALSSLYFLYVQAFFIGAWCIYCLFSAFLTFVLAGVIILIWSHSRADVSATQNTV